jgi:hypothetical protein
VRLPRTTGALSGVLIIVLGVWGALIPFIGPYFHYAFGSYSHWHFTMNRLWLNIVPGAVAVIGGLMLLNGARRSTGVTGGWLAIAAGAWFAIGPAVSLLWHAAGNPIGAPTGGHIRQMLEWLGYFSGLGVVIASLAAFATGRFVSRPRVVEEPVVARRRGSRGAVADRSGEPVADRGAPVADRRSGEAVTDRRAGEAAPGETAADRTGETTADRTGEPVADRPADEAATGRSGEAVRDREPAAERERPEGPATT